MIWEYYIGGTEENDSRNRTKTSETDQQIKFYYSFLWPLRNVRIQKENPIICMVGMHERQTVYAMFKVTECLVRDGTGSTVHPHIVHQPQIQTNVLIQTFIFYIII